MSYVETAREQMRLAILRMLEDAPSFTSNISLLAPMIGDLGLQFSRDQVVGEIQWLRDQGLVTTEKLKKLLLVTATFQGVDVARGVVSHPGVERFIRGS